jgi:hypothetical protein
MTEKIRDKAGLVFFNCPHFKELREDASLGGAGGMTKDEMKELSTKGRLSIKTLNKKSEEFLKDEKKLKNKRQGKKNDPSIKAVKDLLRKMIRYHEKRVQETIPCIYPLLGPANSDSDENEEGDGFQRDEKKSRTKKEIKSQQY